MVNNDDNQSLRSSVSDPTEATEVFQAGGDVASPGHSGSMDATLLSDGIDQANPMIDARPAVASGKSGRTPSISPDDTVDLSSVPVDAQVDGAASGTAAKASGGEKATIITGQPPSAQSSSSRPVRVYAKEPASARAESRFHSIKAHAKGGLGEVFLARDLELGRTVALKEIQNRYSMNRLNQDRFVAEAVITGALEHPGIVPIYGLGRYRDGRPYYAMRFITGTSFQAKIHAFHASKQDGQRADYFGRDFKGLLRIFIEVCQAIHYAHEHGVLHRDIKPDNVMLGQYGETMVVDWGLAKVLDDGPSQKFATNQNPVLKSLPTETATGAVMGTPAYMSPEQARAENDDLDARSDIYSLGATLFTLLSGQKSVEGRSSLEVIENVRQGKLRTLQTAAPEVPPALASICAKAMSVRREDRYADAGCMVEDIERWLADELVLAHRGLESLGERLGRWVRRHHTWVVAGGMFLTAFLVLAIGAIALINRARSREMLARQQAEVAKAEALERYRQSRQAIDTWLVGSNDALQFFPGTQSIRTRMLELAAEDYRQLAVSPSRDPDLELERARALIRLGDIQQIQMKADQARTQYDEAITVLISIPKDATIGHLAEAESAHAAIRSAAAYAMENRWGEALQRFAPAIETLMTLVDRHPQQWSIANYLTAGMIGSAEASLAMGQIDPAIDSLQDAIDRCDRLSGGETPESAATDALLLATRGRELLGRAHQTRGEYQAADKVLENAIDVLTSASLAHPDDPRWFDALASTSLSRANLQRSLGMQQAMEESLSLAAEHYQKLMIAMPDVPSHMENLALTYADLGLAQWDDRRPDDAERSLDVAKRLLQDLLRVYPDIARYHEQSAVCDDALSQIVLERDVDGERSFALAANAVRTYQELSELFPETIDYRHRLAISRSHAALAVAQQHASSTEQDDTTDVPDGRAPIPEDVELLMQAAMGGLRELVAEYPDVSDYRYSLGHVLNRYALLVAQSTEPEISRDLFSQAIDLWRTLAEGGHAEASEHLALLLMTCPIGDLRDNEEALATANRAIAASPSNLRYQSTGAVAMALGGEVATAKTRLASIRMQRGDWAAADLWAMAICAAIAADDDADALRQQAEAARQELPGCTRLNGLSRLLVHVEVSRD